MMTALAPSEFLLYSIALLAQFISIALAIAAYRYSGHYRYAWGLMCFVLLAMLGRRMIGLSELLQAKSLSLLEAGITSVISLGMMAAIFSLKNIFDDLEKQKTALKGLTLTDPLTGALNRSGIISHLEEEFQRANRSHKPVGVLMIDIDHFKQVNDHYGHLVGDEVLSNLIVIFQRSLREIDSIGRYGGEEFLIILPDASKEQATVAAERIRKNVEQASCAFAKEKPIKITVSVGIAVYKPPLNKQEKLAFNIREYIRRSDVAMYFAKKSGRNQVVPWDPKQVID